ncbi:MAG: hypothetical protein H6651_03330 [Ardenticatenales bacterium]|nr:hypothetical protein [Ardenticatenales bacterium]
MITPSSTSTDPLPHPAQLPPFRRMAKLVLADPVNNRAQQGSGGAGRRAAAAGPRGDVERHPDLRPRAPFFSRIDGRYRWQIIIRAPDPRRLLDVASIPPPPGSSTSTPSAPFKSGHGLARIKHGFFLF